LSLVPFWFIVIAFFWTGFFILEGFDFGVGMLHTVVGTDDASRRAAINTIGPLWDLALVLLLVALIARGLAFEYRGKRNALHWRRTWDVLLTVGSIVAPLLIGVALGDLLHGLPINAAHNYTGSFWDLLQPYAIFTGVTLVLICALHGATFLSLKTTGDLCERSILVSRRVAPFTAAFVVGFIIWTHITHTNAFLLNPIELLAVVAVIAAVWLVYDHPGGFAFTATTVTMASCIVAIFTGLYPNVMISSTNPAYNLTVHNTASPAYALKVMSVIAIVLVPLILAYQSWTYYVFRKRVSASDFQTPAHEPAPQPTTPARPGN
jgi:cytochrome bd ubiquinol oxidase subunit II